ncbi:MAG: GTP-binding protein [Candidatus Cloacimonetes bacterium]|nr:GTP-binding protein [Candidatus Cloacimonadota bacterium]
MQKKYEETKKIAEEVSKEVEFEEKGFKEEFDKKMEELKKSRKPNIAIIGPANTGKSELVNALFGYDIVKTKNIPGVTKENFVKEQRFGVVIMDTPGYGTGDESDRLEARKAIQESDLVIIVYNVMVGVKTLGLAPIEDAKELGKKTIIVLNQIDLASFQQRDEQRDFLIKQGFENIVEISALTGEGMNILINKIYENIPEECRIDFLRSVIADKEEAEKRTIKAIEEKLKRLEEKKKRKEKLSDSEKDFVKNSNEFIKNTKRRINNITDAKSKLANKWIFGSGATAAGIGAIPLPIGDIIPLKALQTTLVIKIGIIYDNKLTSKTVVSILGYLCVGELFRELFRQLAKIIPVAGSIIGAFVASGGTIAIGFTAKIILSSKDIELNSEEFRKKYNEIIPKIMSALRSKKQTIENLGKKENEEELGKIFEEQIHEENLKS